MTTTYDEATYRHWLDQEVDGALEETERDRLHAALRANSALAEEKHALEGLHRLIADSRIPEREGFAESVYASLPVAAWEQRRSAWWLPVAMLLLFGVAGGALLTSAGTAVSGPLGTVIAVADFFQTAVLAGAGMIGVTWQGIGIALDELLAASKLNVAAFAIGVLCLNVLFWRLLRRPRAVGQQAQGDRDNG